MLRAAFFLQPGDVYDSRKFAAVATLEGLGLSKQDGQLHFTCVDVGQTEWHKDYGTEPIDLLHQDFADE